MKLLRNQKEIIVYKTQRPKFGTIKATWSDSTILIDNKEINIFWECMRGQNYFFEYDKNWYRIPFYVGKFPFLEENMMKINYMDSFQIK